MDSIDGGTRLRTKEFAHLRTLHQGAHSEHGHFIGNRERLPNRRPQTENRHRALRGLCWRGFFDAEAGVEE
ncbi:hypothetical protein ACQP2U_07040 [Nocardia sp. CA-084685]|uniref:hypothetical protein n=1 Tax=Nocardia sp. CA-084685 TaxID=3239970 RepID=UPI003D96B917